MLSGHCCMYFLHIFLSLLFGVYIDIEKKEKRNSEQFELVYQCKCYSFRLWIPQWLVLP